MSATRVIIFALMGLFVGILSSEVIAKKHHKPAVNKFAGCLHETGDAAKQECANMCNTRYSDRHVTASITSTEYQRHCHHNLGCLCSYKGN